MPSGTAADSLRLLTAVSLLLTSAASRQRATMIDLVEKSVLYGAMMAHTASSPLGPAHRPAAVCFPSSSAQVDQSPQ